MARDRILIPAHIPGHWVLLVVQHSTRTITVYDSLWSLSGIMGQQLQGLVQRVNNWLKGERQRLTVHQDIASNFEYGVTYKHGGDAPRQADGFSCGAFVAAAAYTLILLGQEPTTGVYNGQQHMPLRLAVLDAALTGRIRLPLPVAAGGAGAGGAAAGAGAVLEEEAPYAPLLSRPPRVRARGAVVRPAAECAADAYVDDEDAPLVLDPSTNVYIESVRTGADMAAVVIES